MRPILAFGLVLSLSSAGLGQSGTRAMTTTPESKLKIGTRSRNLDESEFTVERYQGDWAWVRTKSGLEGWLPRRDIVPLDQAVAYFTKKITDNPGVSGWYFRRGTAHESLGNVDAALADISVAIALDPRVSDYLNTRGNIYDKKRDYERAIADYNAALRLEPGDWMLWYNAALTRHDAKQYDKAIQNFSRSIQLNPSIPITYFLRARSWEAKGDYERALSDVARTVSLDPKNVDAYNLRATIWATCPDARYRDGKRAVSEALKACELSAWAKAMCVST